MRPFLFMLQISEATGLFLCIFYRAKMFQILLFHYLHWMMHEDYMTPATFWEG